jgi:hypothetical protein
MSDFARAGSQRWLQLAVNRKPQLLLAALERCKAIAPGVPVTWSSPLDEAGFEEYRDQRALEKTGIGPASLRKPLEEFWPTRGPVWDALGTTSEGRSLFVEAKAHIPEAASPATRANSESLKLISKSLCEARRFYAPKATAIWNNVFYQYANRLAHHYFLTEVNGLTSSLVFLYFVNARDMQGPVSEEEWHGAIRLVHAVLGLPKDLKHRGVFDSFLDVTLLDDGL